MCSPDISYSNGEYLLTFNSWGAEHPNGEHNWLFSMVSPDLEKWSEPSPVGTNLNKDHRVIDIAVAYENNKYFVIWKDEKYDNYGKKKYQTRIGVCKRLNGDLAYIGDGCPRFERVDGLGSKFIHENYEFINIDRNWYLLTTDYGPHRPTLYQMKEGRDGSKDEDWMSWCNGRDFDIPVEKFNTNHPANAAFLADWRKYDGYFYLIYGGRTHGLTHAGRGNNKLGIARSSDLKKWIVPPN